jgi:hypothetical protein
VTAEETVPALDDEPQGACWFLHGDRRFTHAVNSSLLVINGCPNPELVALVANLGLQFIPRRLLLGFLQLRGHLFVDAQLLE